MPDPTPDEGPLLDRLAAVVHQAQEHTSGNTACLVEFPSGRSWCGGPRREDVEAARAVLPVVREVAAGAPPGQAAELGRLRRVEAAARGVWESHGPDLADVVAGGTWEALRDALADDEGLSR